MKQLGKWMLGAAVAVGTLGLASTANAAQFGIYVSGGPAAYVPPCPGPGYQWVAGYYTNGYWIPGRWAYVGARYQDRDDYRVYYRDHDADRGRVQDRDRGRDRNQDRDRDRSGYRDRR